MTAARLLALAALVLPAALAQPISVSIATRQAGAAISPTALGLSYETSRMAPDETGTRYFRPDNQPLLELFRTLGIRSLRIGGNSVDDPKLPLPAMDDVRSLFQFAKAAGVKVIYSVRLQDGDPKSAAAYAKLIHDEFPGVIESFAIGNEPGYYKDYSVYRPRWTAIRDAILAVYPDAGFSGPDQNPDPVLIKSMVRDFGGKSGRLVQISQHSYPLGCSYRNPKDGMKDVALLQPFDAAESRAKMLSPSVYPIYEKIRAGMAEAVAGTPVTFRLSETNSYWFSGLKGASDSYASALWGLDYLHWWTSHGAEGLNFHTGDRTGGSVNLPCRYAVFVSSRKGYEARPLSYGLKLFSLGSQGRGVPVIVTAAPDQNLTAYAVLGDDHSLLVTLINKSHGAAAQEVEVTIQLDAEMKGSAPRMMQMTAKGGDIAAGSRDILLGGKPIHENGTWKGRWTALPKPAAKTNTLVLSLPPASATLLRLGLR